REVGKPEVLPAAARRPGRCQLELTAVDEHAVGDHAERDRIAGAEQTGTAQVAAARIGGRADAVVEVATEVVARTGPGRLDVDTRQHRPAPLVVRRGASRGASRGTWAGASRRSRTRVVGRVDLVEDRRHTKPAPGLVDREVHPRSRMLVRTKPRS